MAVEWERNALVAAVVLLLAKPALDQTMCYGAQTRMQVLTTKHRN